MNTVPLVSILIPTFNRSKYLQEAIDSALGQTWQNCEILILDDASPDDTSEVVKKYRDNPNVQYIRHDKNLGITGNWRYGITHCRGDYFFLLHDDDYIESNCIEALIKPLLIDPEIIFSFCDQLAISDTGEKSPQESEAMSKRFKRTDLPEGILQDFARTALIDYSLGIGATLFRRNFFDVDWINDEAKGQIDYWIFYQCVKSKKSTYYISERLVRYRCHSGGMSHSMPVYMAQGALYRYSICLQDSDIKDLWPEIREQEFAVRIALSLSLLQNGDFKEARKIFNLVLETARPTPKILLIDMMIKLGPSGQNLLKTIRTIKKLVYSINK